MIRRRPQFPLKNEQLREHYLQHRADDGFDGSLVATVSSDRAVGASTHAEDIAREFPDIEVRYAGNLQRAKAEDAGYENAHEFRKADPDADLQMDAAILDAMTEHEYVLIEGRLANAIGSALRKNGEPIAAYRAWITATPLDQGRRWLVRNGEYDDVEDVPLGTAHEAEAIVHERDSNIHDSFIELYGTDGREKPGQEVQYATEVVPTSHEQQLEAYGNQVVGDTDSYTVAHRRLVAGLIEAGFPYPARLGDEERDALGV